MSSVEFRSYLIDGAEQKFGPDVPTRLPEDQIVEVARITKLLLAGDNLDDAEFAESPAVIDEAKADIAAGCVVGEEGVLATLRAIE